ncbi:MAG: histidine kinase [Frankiales bacterium]|jgi:signal transduction histidine kinase|nr:histidine kinase [Frankiales bacterium]
MRPPAALTGWWFARSLRTRLVVGSVVPLAAALLVGTVAVVAVFAAGRMRQLDVQTAREADVLVQLVSSGQLPRPLPVPAGSTLLAQVLDRSGVVLAASPAASQARPLVDGLVGRAPGTFTEEAPAYGDGPVRVRTASSVVGGRPVLVVVAAPLADVRRAIGALRVVLLLVVPALVLAATLLARLVIGSSLRPVERLREAAGRIAASGEGPGQLLPVGERDDEVSRLAGTLNDVLGRLQSALRQQRAFVADAAHELRSPLASMRVQLDVARAHPDLVDGAQLVADLDQEVDRLQELVDDLLLLARLDARQPAPFRPVDLSALAGTNGTPVRVLGDRAALQRLLRNLTDNAGRYAATVRVAVVTDGGAAVLTVDDDGPGIPSEDRERIFDRWVRLDPGRSRPEGGAGLGLTLVREIAAAHGGVVSATDSPLGGARLQVRLPRLP